LRNKGCLLGLKLAQISFKKRKKKLKVCPLFHSFHSLVFVKVLCVKQCFSTLVKQRVFNYLNGAFWRDLIINC
jgi:hypothetical protein